MEARIAGSAVHYIEHGDGMPILVLHGAGVDHREIAVALEPAFAAAPRDHRRLYPDLPGMGKTPMPAAVMSNDDVLDLLIGFAGEVIGDHPYLVVGHSYGAYLARALADAEPDRVAGLALIAPVGAGTEQAAPRPQHRALVSTVDAERELAADLAETYRTYFVLQTPQTLERHRRYIAPSAALVDWAGLTRVFANWTLRDRRRAPASDDRPVLILAGRQDSIAGSAHAQSLADHYARATVGVLDRAGHALLHEQPGLAAALLLDWLDRCDGLPTT
ncbi:alpha/beta fold hydrolase [Pseudactinotalea sp. HY158]|uniref:alpha/beta fold hydrolase n=1 Tax=Pseudactinotalea sp. HY158 TaxID=2654547 RepID=UPI00129CF081|nr:alpha/beta fold hydrolase [Pseudactinotalea sp. HY158]QGH69015.1 alpha/beta fold hydrolase [Pseudactinotalea sp. HY158]